MTRGPVVRLETTVSFRLDLASPAPCGVAGAPSFSIREVSRDELAAAASQGGLLEAGHPDDLDAAAAAPWRCFAAFDETKDPPHPVHHLFVALRPAGPLLFRGYTAPAWRGRGVFTHVVGHIAGALARDGHATLDSSCGARNRASIRAHLASGFVETGRRFEPYLLGVDLRALARRLLRR